MRIDLVFGLVSSSLLLTVLFVLVFRSFSIHCLFAYFCSIYFRCWCYFRFSLFLLSTLLHSTSGKLHMAQVVVVVFAFSFYTLSFRFGCWDCLWEFRVKRKYTERNVQRRMFKVNSCCTIGSWDITLLIMLAGEYSNQIRT